MDMQRRSTLYDLVRYVMFNVVKGKVFKHQSVVPVFVGLSVVEV